MAEEQGKDSAAETEKVIRYPVIKVRLYPNHEQSERLEKTFGSCRYLWNQTLADVQEFYAATDIHYIPTPAKYKKSAPFLTEVDSQALCAVHQNLRKAFMDFFRAPKRYRHPQFKTKKAQKDSFTVYCRPYRSGPSIALTEDGVRMPKLGCIKARLHRKPECDWLLRSVTVTKTRSGKYFCSIVFRSEEAKASPVIPTKERTIGINHSLIHFYVDSEGNSIDVPDAVRHTKAKLIKMQQKLSRMDRGSKNYQEQSQRIRLLQEHIANQRKDFVHKESRRITNAWDAVCVRDTDLIKLSQQIKGLNVMSTGFGVFRECLKYKLIQQGKIFIVIDQYAPTAKTCHECGFVYEALSSREREWTCPHCKTTHFREVNAAQNIRDWGLAQFRKQEAGA